MAIFHAIQWLQGSPPLTRGIPQTKYVAVSIPGFTPAHAGNTGLSPVQNCLDQVHPRSRGEYFACFKFLFIIQGSPPLTRGILHSDRKSKFSLRFTPAHAGNTANSPALSNAVQVHPRSRGEYFFRFCSSVLSMGSPPLTRGILRKAEFRVAETRFTPAHAGNT